ncbi:type IX secretion system membrane protein PorP/SprF [uncultured Olleya sp.]|uniref:PorP/SprF family type IX secretion system membrane protein n=1 Tax=uncultured Olleya sp. TaxID=757243 RepID=UPI000483452F|nr:type IX secretion system membrane protein PorP/SprF [uncultured Olleya sp.]
MRNYFILFLGLFSLGFYSNESHAQQDAQYTQYMYNTLSVNPAYAGSRDVLSFIGLYRTQWVGLDGAPDTFTASVHSPVGEKVGLGLNITQDEIFITSETYIDLSFSYTLDIGNASKLALGVKGGGHFLNIDTNKLNTGAFNPGDSDAEINVDNKFSPQFGLGVYYYSDKFYLGLSAPNVLETEHFDENAANNNSFATAKEKVNFYIMAGRTFDLNADLKFKPSTLVKFVDGAPLQVDLSANFLIQEKLTLGAAYRWSAALSAMAGFQVSNQIMLGVAYDRETTQLKQFNDGSYEVFLRFELFKRSNRMISPRFF